MVKENCELRALAREQLTGHWMSSMMIYLVYCMLISTAIISGCVTGLQFIITVIHFESFMQIGGLNLNHVVGVINVCMIMVLMILGFTITILISAPLLCGLCNYFFKISKKEMTTLEDLFSGFYFLKNNVLLYLLQATWILWSTLFLVVPGILSILHYSQAFFILQDNPQMKAIEVLRQSKQMMQGYKKRFLLLQVSFLGWFILGIMSLGIGLLWILPYSQTTFANFYHEIREEYLRKYNQNKIIDISAAKDKK